MEDFIWIIAPAAGAWVVLALARRIGFLKDVGARGGIGAALFAVALGFAVAPRCFCSNPTDLLVGSVVFGVLWGMVSGLVFFAGATLLRR